MWIFTNFGFFSVVEKPEDKGTGMLTVRGRVRSDLEALRNKYLPSLGEISSSGHNDYQYRARASREAVAVALLKAITDIDYDNFKGSVEQVQGIEREKVYTDVWRVLLKLKKAAPMPSAKQSKSPASSSLLPAYGGVLFNERGQVLLIEPAKHFDNTVWTWPKGKSKGNENAEQTALREVLEEGGYHAEILGPIPGSWKGSTGPTEYFLMSPVGQQGVPDYRETASTKWVDADAAPDFIRKTGKATARERDLEVLAAALKTRSAMNERRGKRR